MVSDNNIPNPEPDGPTVSNKFDVEANPVRIDWRVDDEVSEEVKRLLTLVHSICEKHNIPMTFSCTFEAGVDTSDERAHIVTRGLRSSIFNPVEMAYRLDPHSVAMSLLARHSEIGKFDIGVLDMPILALLHAASEVIAHAKEGGDDE